MSIKACAPSTSHVQDIESEGDVALVKNDMPRGTRCCTRREFRVTVAPSSTAGYRLLPRCNTPSVERSIYSFGSSHCPRTKEGLLPRLMHARKIKRCDMIRHTDSK